MYTICTTKLVSQSPYSQSRIIDALEHPKKEKEGADDYDARIWREKMHTNADGEVYIPAMALKTCLSEAAKYLSLQIPGKGKSTYTKHFEAGVMILDDVPLGILAKDVKAERLYLNADGRRGGTTRVWRRMPRIDKWSAEVTWHVLDPMITEQVFLRVLREAGNLIGIGRWRPRNNGIYGRFALDRHTWKTGT